jgi:thiol-disulfide isomerase/thioredoxin
MSSVVTMTRSLQRGCVLAVFFLLGASAALAADPAPPLELPDSTGTVRKLADYRGKIVVLNFWATWCSPCANEMPMLADMNKRYADKGVTVVGASLDDEETKEFIPKYMKSYKMKFPVLVGATADDLEHFVGGDAMPGTAFIDKDGNIVARIRGEARKREIQERLDWMLGLTTGGKEPAALIDHSPKIDKKGS